MNVLFLVSFFYFFFKFVKFFYYKTKDFINTWIKNWIDKLQIFRNLLEIDQK